MKPNIVLTALLLLVAGNLVIPLSTLVLIAIGSAFALYKGYTSDDGIHNIFNIKRVSYSLRHPLTRAEAAAAGLFGLLTTDIPYWWNEIRSGLSLQGVGYLLFEWVTLLLFVYVMFRFLLLGLFEPGKERTPTGLTE